MKKLEKLKQDKSGLLYRMNGDIVKNEIRVGQLRVIALQNPVVDIQYFIDELTQRQSAIIPEGTNAYSASDFNYEAQFLKNNKAFSCYALQFYHIFNN